MEGPGGAGLAIAIARGKLLVEDEKCDRIRKTRGGGIICPRETKTGGTPRGGKSYFSIGSPAKKIGEKLLKEGLEDTIFLRGGERKAIQRNKPRKRLV